MQLQGQAWRVVGACLFILSVVIVGVLAQTEFRTPQNTPVNITLDAPDDLVAPLRFLIDDDPQNGTLLGTAPMLTYVPDTGFSGTDSLAYTIVDAEGTVVTSRISIIVGSPDDILTEDERPALPAIPDARDTSAAIAPNTAISTSTGSAASIQLVRGRDYAIIDPPQHGSLTGRVPNVSYTPDSDFSGVDSFTYRVEANGVTRVIPIAVLVAPNSDAPQASSGDVTLTVVELDATAGIEVGESFDVQIQMTDRRNGEPETVFAGFTDLTFDPSVLQAESITHAASYPHFRRGTIDNNAGIVRDLGAVTDQLNVLIGDTTVATVRFTALASGVTALNTDVIATERLETVLYGSEVDNRNDLSYNGTSVTVTEAQSNCPASADSIGIYRDSDRSWYLKDSNSDGNADTVFDYGDPEDIALVGDWDGDGVDTVGIYRDSVFYLSNSNRAGNADTVFAFGASGDLPVAGDWDGDCIDEVGLYRPAQGVWFLLFDNAVQVPDLVFQYGLTNETPIAGDWDGDGVDTVGIYRASDRSWYLKNDNSDGFADIVFPYGDPASDLAIAGDWDGDGVDTVGTYRFATGEWYLKNSNVDGVADLAFQYGLTDETPVVGDWDGN